MDNSSPSADWSSATWSQRRYFAVCLVKLLFPEIDGGMALVKSLFGCLSSKFIKKLNYAKPLFNTLLGEMTGTIRILFHETTIAVSKVTFYINLFHLVPNPSSPPESNMFLNFCNVGCIIKVVEK